MPESVPGIHSHGETDCASNPISTVSSSRQPHGSTPDEDMMNNRIDIDLLLAERADQVAHLSDELRNAKALADKLQTLLDSKTHQADALHKELDNAIAANELITTAANLWQDRAEQAARERAAVTTLLIAHAAVAFLAGDPSPEEIARHVLAKIAADAEPDMDTVPLQALLEAVGTFLEHDQAVTIRGSYEATSEVDIQAMGLTFRVPTFEASEAITRAAELGQCLLVEVGA